MRQRGASLPLPDAAIVPDRDGREYLPQAYHLPVGEARSALVSRLPRCVFIEVTNRCNLLCETCPRTFVTYEPLVTLSWDSFVRVVGQFPDMERAVLHGIGEPLMNKALPRMISRLKQRGVTVLFNTNATLLDEGWARALIASGLDELRVSLDGADPDTYARIRGAPAFHKVLGNLAGFSALQRQMGAAAPRASIWMMAMRENMHELPALVRLAAQAGIPEVYVQRLVYYLDKPMPPGLMNESHAVFGDGVAEMEEIIAEAEAVAATLGIVLKAAGATAPRRSLQGSHGLPRPWSACLRPWTTAYVTANGNCLPCCISPFATQDYASLNMGNLFESAFVDIWNNERYQAWRTALLGDNPHTACQGCGVHWSL